MPVPLILYGDKIMSCLPTIPMGAGPHRKDDVCHSPTTKATMMKPAEQATVAERLDESKIRPILAEGHEMLSSLTEPAALTRLSVPSPKAMEKARRFAASMLRAAGRPDLATSAVKGHGDDFPEVVAAAPLFQEQIDFIERWQQALRTYAAAEFWDDDMPGGSLASHDRGEMAVNVLAGRPPFYHRE